MPSQTIFVAIIEVSPLQGCQLNYEQFAGAAVRCYVTADEEMAALKRFREALARDAFRITNIEWCVRSDSVEWENPNEPIGAALRAEAVKTGEVVYAEFHAWGYDAPDAPETPAPND